MTLDTDTRKFLEEIQERLRKLVSMRVANGFDLDDYADAMGEMRDKIGNIEDDVLRFLTSHE